MCAFCGANFLGVHVVHLAAYGARPHELLHLFEELVAVAAVEVSVGLAVGDDHFDVGVEVLAHGVCPY